MNTKTFDSTTYATNQAVLRVSRDEHARYKGRTALGRAYLRVNSYLPSVFWFGGIVGGFRWKRFSEWFLHGDTNPAVVLDASQGLVAAYTDLDSRLEKRFPVVKVFAEKLWLLPTPAKDGDTFAAVSAYAGGGNSRRTGRWRTFYPLVVDCVIQDEVKCQFAKAKIRDAEWKALEIGLSQLPAKPRPGLYDVVLPDELKAAL